MAVNLNKITLDKPQAAAKLSLSKALGDIKVNLSWKSGTPKPKGFFQSLFGGGDDDAEIDLDLGVFVELADGRKALLDPLQSPFKAGFRGSLSEAPFVHHSGDDRAGGGGETLMVSGKNADRISRIIVYTFIYVDRDKQVRLARQGKPMIQWSQTDAVVRLEVPGQSEVEVLMGQQGDDRTFCALAEVKFHEGQSVEVTRLMSFHDGHEDCDRRYGWGFQWSPGQK
jgi:tellurite resistance protein TerA